MIVVFIISNIFVMVMMMMMMVMVSRRKSISGCVSIMKLSKECGC